MPALSGVTCTTIGTSSTSSSPSSSVACGWEGRGGASVAAALRRGPGGSAAAPSSARRCRGSPAAGASRRESRGGTSSYPAPPGSAAHPSSQARRACTSQPCRRRTAAHTGRSVRAEPAGKRPPQAHPHAPAARRQFAWSGEVHLERDGLLERAVVGACAQGTDARARVSHAGLEKKKSPRPPMHLLPKNP